MSETEFASIAHLMRRAGFGATYAELEALADKGYEQIVEELIHPERAPDMGSDVIERYWDGEFNAHQGNWIFRMINSPRPLEEKLALFWHHVLATAWYKSEHIRAVPNQIDMFRRIGFSDFREILLELSRDPAMIFWLDNNENRKNEPNENYGRELLELFSMGVGNYTEQDIKMAARAFTGWTFAQPIPLYPHGDYDAEFVFREDDHDHSNKTFLGETGRFNGEDIIDIIVKQPATARFVSRHLYNFFVADEPQVPSWNQVPPQDPQAIETLVKAYFDSGGNIRSMLRVLFNSGFFKEARLKRVKSPTELIVGTIKLTGSYRFPDRGLLELIAASRAMGQEIMNPPTVEGWHTGKEWIDGGTLNERVNFAVTEMSDVTKPGIQDIVSRLRSEGETLSPEVLIDRILVLAGSIEASRETRSALVNAAESRFETRFDSEDDKRLSADWVGHILQLVVSSREYQFA